MDIRIATPEDIVKIIEMCFAFSESSDYTKYVEAEQIGKMAAAFLTQEDKVILVNNAVTGMVWGLKTQFPWGSAQVCTEMLWWVDPSERGNGLGNKLLEALGAWAKEQECVIVALASLDLDIGNVFEKHGFKLYERTYWKEI